MDRTFPIVAGRTQKIIVLAHDVADVKAIIGSVETALGDLQREGKKCSVFSAVTRIGNHDPLGIVSHFRQVAPCSFHASGTRHILERTSRDRHDLVQYFHPALYPRIGTHSLSRMDGDPHRPALALLEFVLMV